MDHTVKSNQAIMSSSPLSSGLSTPQKVTMKGEEEAMEEEEGDEEAEEEAEEEEDEAEDEEEEEEQEEEEVDENEEEAEMEDPIQNESTKRTDPQLIKQGAQAHLIHPPLQRRRFKRVHGQKVLGTTILPATRVTRAAKQDKDIKIVTKEAVFLISIATEYFIKKLTNSALERSKREKRVFVKYNDVAMAVKKNSEYDWLEEVIPTSLPLGAVLRDPMIPSSATALTNQLPVETVSSLKASSVPSPQDKLISHSNSNPALHSMAEGIMDVDDDQDELDEEV